MDLTEEEKQDIANSLNDVIEDYLEENSMMFSKKDYFDKFVHDQYSFITGILVETDWDEEKDDALYSFIEDYCKETLGSYCIPLRENGCTILNMSKEEITSSLHKVNQCPVQKQRTPEWYVARYNLFSASSLWKLFGSQSQYNSIIFEKCKGLDVQKVEYSNLLMPDARNWGIRYEPVTVMVYEDKYKTKVNTEYGCIPHDVLPIGASPDGIVCDETSEKYGHMVEIKNIYNREIDGIPSEEYWIQMQTQLEVCNLNICDFVETRFKEYASKEEYEQDETQEYKGVILCFIPRNPEECKTYFEYVPLRTENLDEYISCLVEKIDTHILYHTFYWYLDEFSCSQIERNDFWFERTIPIIKEGWETVLKERVEGYEHRAPQKRKASEDNTLNNNKIPEKVTVVKLE